MRKLTCLRWRQTLAEYATTDRTVPENSALAKHLTTCAECSREFDWYCATHRDLQASLTAERTAPGFADATWERFTAAPSPRPTFSIARTLPAMACITGIALLLFVKHLWRPLPVNVPNRNAIVAIKPQAKGSHLPAAPASKSGRSTPEVGIATAGIRKKVTDHPQIVRHRGVRRTHSQRLITHGTPARKGEQVASNSRRPDFSWERLASWYEVQGDYRSAAAAYDQAARENPTEVREFNAGRTAECAGDMSQAIAYYAQVLTHGRAQEAHLKQDLPPEKGTSQWNENRYFL